MPLIYLMTQLNSNIQFHNSCMCSFLVELWNKEFFGDLEIANVHLLNDHHIMVFTTLILKF